MAASDSVNPKHPARKAILAIIILSLFAWILSLIAIFVPWSWKDVAVDRRATIDLWQNCLRQVSDPLKTYTCWENDVDQVGSVAGGDMKCRGYFVATQVFTVAAVCFTFLTLILAAMMFNKLWMKPTMLGCYLATLTLLAFGCCLVAFLMWIVYAQQVCQPGNPLFPVVGYSWGWICMVVATFLMFLAMLAAYWALLKIMRFRPMITPPDVGVPMQTVVPIVAAPSVVMVPSPSPVMGAAPAMVVYQ